MQKLEKTAKAWAITGNRLTDGDVCYFAEDGTWPLAFDEAAVFLDKAEADAALARAQVAIENQVMASAYLFEVRDEDGETVPASVREKIRARGPTVREDLGKQAAHP